jgi:hypothetical protein
MLSDAAGTLVGIVALGDPNDTRGVSPEDLPVEQMRVGYFSIAAILATLVLLNLGAAVSRAVGQIAKGMAASSSSSSSSSSGAASSFGAPALAAAHEARDAADSLADEDTDGAESDDDEELRVTAGAGAGAVGAGVDAGAPAAGTRAQATVLSVRHSTDSARALTATGAKALLRLLAVVLLPYLLVQRLALPLLAEEAVMPVEQMRIAFCETAGIVDRCGGWLTGN